MQLGLLDNCELRSPEENWRPQVDVNRTTQEFALLFATTS